LADEAFFCGTGVEVMPIGTIDHRAVGDGQAGPIASQIREVYGRVVRGEEAKYSAWLTPVPALEKA
jgi:branched-chain amino acid aminotransferase